MSSQTSCDRPYIQSSRSNLQRFSIFSLITPCRSDQGLLGTTSSSASWRRTDRRSDFQWVLHEDASRSPLNGTEAPQNVTGKKRVTARQQIGLSSWWRSYLPRESVHIRCDQHDPTGERSGHVFPRLTSLKKNLNVSTLNFLPIMEGRRSTPYGLIEGLRTVSETSFPDFACSREVALVAHGRVEPPLEALTE